MREVESQTVKEKALTSYRRISCPIHPWQKLSDKLIPIINTPTCSLDHTPSGGVRHLIDKPPGRSGLIDR